MSNIRYQVALCSTQQDLVQERAIVSEALAANNAVTTGFAFPNLTDNYLWKLVQRAIADADVVLILLGTHYGAISKSGAGYVHQALAHAKVLQKPIYALIYDDQGRGQSNIQDPIKLAQFQQQLCQYPHSFWHHHDELRDLAEMVLEQIQDTHNLTGWLPAQALMGTDPINQQLKKQIALLDIALKKERENNHYTSGDFLQQDQIYTLNYQCNAFRNGTLIQVEGSSSLPIYQYFHELAAMLASGCTIAKIKSCIAQLLQHNELTHVQKKVPNAHAITQLQIDEQQLEQLLLTLRAFGLIQYQTKLWYLTPFGDHLALKKAQKNRD